MNYDLFVLCKPSNYGIWSQFIPSWMLDHWSWRASTGAVQCFINTFWAVETPCVLQPYLWLEHPSRCPIQCIRETWGFLLNDKNEVAGTFLSLSPLVWAWPESHAAETSELRVWNCPYSVNLYWTRFPLSWTRSSLTLGTRLAENMSSIFFRRSASLVRSNGV